MATRLPPDLLTHLRAVLTSNDDLVEAPDWRALAHALRTRPVDLIVLDPRPGQDENVMDDGHQPSALLTLLAEFQSVPVVVYTAYAPDAIQAALRLTTHGVHDVMFHEFNDTPSRLRDLLDRVAARVMGEQLLAVILPRLAACNAPAEVTQAIVRLFHAPHAFRSVQQLANAASRQRGILDRWVQRAGLAPPKVLLLAARAAWVFHYARAPGTKLKTLGLRLGYTDPVSFGRHMKAITGMTPSTLRTEVTPDELLRTLLSRIGCDGALP